MPLSPAQVEQLNELRKQWSTLEGELKDAEFLSSKPVIPAINALRYAGRQMVELLYLGQLPSPTPQEVEAISRAFIIADDYMHRAAADIIDALFFFIDADVRIMREKYGDLVIERDFPKLGEFVLHLTACRTLITQSRKDVSTRTGNYQTLSRERYKPMLELYEELSNVEDSGIIPERAREAEREQRSYGWTLYAGVLAPIGLLATILASIETEAVRHIVYRSYPLLLAALAWFTHSCLISKGYPTHAAQIRAKYGWQAKTIMGGLILLGIVNIYPATPKLILSALAAAPSQVGSYCSRWLATPPSGFLSLPSLPERPE